MLDGAEGDADDEDEAGRAAEGEADAGVDVGGIIVLMLELMSVVWCEYLLEQYLMIS